MVHKLTTILFVAAMLAAACSGGSASPTARPGSADVYSRIAALTDCTALQTEFDTASANHDRARGAGRPAEAAASTAYMKAADARMRELRCY